MPHLIPENFDIVPYSLSLIGHTGCIEGNLFYHKYVNDIVSGLPLSTVRLQNFRDYGLPPMLVRKFTQRPLLSSEPS